MLSAQLDVEGDDYFQLLFTWNHVIAWNARNYINTLNIWNHEIVFWLLVLIGILETI